MKHIKKYNTWEKIDKEEYASKYLPLDTETILTDIPDINNLVKLIRTPNASWGGKYHFHNGDDGIYIHESPDEWYLILHVVDGPHIDYYKCDQLEGLIDFIKHIITK